MDLLSKLKSALFGSHETPGEAWASKLIRSFESEAVLVTPGWRFGRGTVESLDTGRQILARVRLEWTELVPVILHRLIEIRAEPHVRDGRDRWIRTTALRDLLATLLRPRLPFSQEQLAAVIDFYATNARQLPGISFRLLLRQAKQFEGGPGEALTAAMARLVEEEQPWGAHGRHVSTFTERLLVDATADGPALLDSPWSDQVRAAFDGLPDAARAVARLALARAIGGGKKSKPDQALLADARAGVAADQGLATRLLEWVEAYAPDPLRRDPNEDAIRGLIWMLGAGEEATVAPRIGRYCERCFKKVPNFGAPSIKLGNAAIQTLALLGGQHAIAELTRLKAKIRYPRVARQIEATLTEVAGQRGVSAEDLAEMSLPTYDLSREGERHLPVGDARAIIRVSGTRDVQLLWVRQGSRETANLPKSLKDAAPEAVAAARKLRKEIEATLAGQTARLEALYLSDRKLPFAQWRERYLEHPLLAGLARRLIWRFDAAGERIDGLPRNDTIEDVDGRPIAQAEGASVRLWHPLHAGADDVLAWRRRLAALGITQPFKQAYREIYVVTEAERQTDIYSNRFAAQILRQHQFKALCDQRGWRYQLMGAWDSHNTPTRAVPGRRLSVEFWVNGADVEANRMGVYALVSTDQVRFVGNDGSPIPVLDVPPMVFSELMRDVDLFVGVASIGNDPNWVDGGAQPRFGAYWREYAFGDLGQSGKIRGEVLASLLPALAIADRCELRDRFLRVRGNRRSYKIHLRSGNIQMEPDDQYLCIVPGRGLSQRDTVVPRLVLPFEGDMTLSIILSKAFLLAADDKITDPSIVAQIKRR
jgi:hypothetical protein